MVHNGGYAFVMTPFCDVESATDTFGTSNSNIWEEGVAEAFSFYTILSVIEKKFKVW